MLHTPPPPLSDKYSPALRELAASLLRKSPGGRPSAAQLLRHPLLAPHVDAVLVSSLGEAKRARWVTLRARWVTLRGLAG